MGSCGSRRSLGDSSAPQLCALNHPARCGVKELFVPHRCLETNWEVSKQIAFASNSFRAKKKERERTFFFFFLKVVLSRWGICRKPGWLGNTRYLKCAGCQLES